MAAFAGLSRQDWPHDPEGLNAFYGNPTGLGGADPAWEAANLVTFSFPWHIKGAQSYRFHKKALPSLMRVLNAIWDYVGRDQTKITFYHLDETGGTYAYRANRNNPNALSNHARGIAIDLAPDENPNRAAWVDQAPPHLPRFVIEAFKQEGWRWGGDFNVTKDAMHFEAVYDQHHDQPPVPAPTGAPIPSPALAPAQQPAIPLSVPGLPPLLGPGALLRGWILDAAVARIDQEIASLQAFRAALVGIEGLSGALSPAAAPAPLPGFLAPLPAAPAPAEPAPPTNVQQGITATMFGGSSDRNTSAYDGHLITDTEPGCSLPYRFPGKPPSISIRGPNGVTVTVPVVDVGPWNTNDPYWTTGSRPQAESGTDMHGRRTNLAGIDLTPATAKALGISGKGKVDWWISQTSTGASMSIQAGTPSTQAQGLQVAAPVAESVMNSKINWTAGVKGLVSAILLCNAVFGTHLVPLTPEAQLILVGLLNTVGDPAIVIFRTWYTNTIMRQSLPSPVRNQLGV